MKDTRKFQVQHSDNVVSFDIHIDFCAKAYYPIENYQVKTEGDSIKSDIIQMSLFWSGNPGENASFEEHLNFFLDNLSKKLSHYLVNHWSGTHWLYKHMNDQEGYMPIFEEHIRIFNVYVDEDYINDGLEVEEI